MNINELNDQELFRLEKIKKYQELGIDPFGQAYNVSHSIEEIRSGGADRATPCAVPGPSSNPPRSAPAPRQSR